jgi:hypothetical protein
LYYVGEFNKNRYVAIRQLRQPVELDQARSTLVIPAISDKKHMDKTLHDQIIIVKNLLSLQNWQQDDIRVKDAIQELEMIINLCEHGSVQNDTLVKEIIEDALLDAKILIR